MFSLFRGRGRIIHRHAGAKSSHINMCAGPILPKMLIFAVPLMFSGILQLLFNAADIVIVGHFAGDHSLAAVGSNMPVIGMLTNLFIGISIGTNVLVSNCFGAKDKTGIEKAVSTSIVLSVISGILLTAVGVVFSRKILLFMNTPAEVLPLATLYLVIYFFCMTPLMLYNFGSAVLRAVGDTKRPLLYLVIAGVINVILNIFFVAYLKLGVAGVAIATVISQSISAVLVVRCLMHETGAIRFVPKQARIDLGSLAKMLRVGVPAGLQGVLFSISNVVIQSSINTFGAVVMAGSCSSDNIELFIYFAMTAFYQAIISFTSQNMGAGQTERVKRVLKVGLICIAAVGGTMGVLTVIFGKSLLGLYSSSDAVIAAGMTRMKIVVPMYAVCGLMEGMAGSIRGMGYSVLPMIVTLIGVCGLRVVWVSTLLDIPMFHSAAMIYMSYPVSWLVTFAAHCVCYHFIKKKAGI